MPQEPELIAIADFHDLAEAELAKSRLESAGIESFLQGENSSLLYGGNLSAVKLLVVKEDSEDAKAALEGLAEADAAEREEATTETPSNG